MIKEAYISFETAKLLKEKWFKFIEDRNELSQAYVHAYTKEGKEVWGCYDPDYYPCITISMALDWFRTEKGIAITPIVAYIVDDEKFVWKVEINVAKTHDTYHQFWRYETYEGAVEAGLKYCLRNLI